MSESTGVGMNTSLIRIRKGRLFIHITTRRAGFNRKRSASAHLPVLVLSLPLQKPTAEKSKTHNHQNALPLHPAQRRA